MHKETYTLQHFQNTGHFWNFCFISLNDYIVRTGSRTVDLCYFIPLFFSNLTDVPTKIGGNCCGYMSHRCYFNRHVLNLGDSTGYFLEGAKSVFD